MRRASVFLAIVAAAACAGAGPKPSFELQFRGFSRATHMGWYAVLEARYGCDTVIVNSYYPTPLGVGSTACTAAGIVRPYHIRVWEDSTGIREEWDYHLRDGTAPPGGGNPGAPWWKEGVDCRLLLEGTSPRYLLVRQIDC
jgi:hypothetical protein